MSDGPHRSLPMSTRWRRVAECGDNGAFAVEDVCAALRPALSEECGRELSPGFVKSIVDLFSGQDGSLFGDQIGTQLEALRRVAGSGIARIILDYAIHFSALGQSGVAALIRATTCAMEDRAVRGARQVEEHYLRKSTNPRALHVRERIEHAITASNMENLARGVLRLEGRIAHQSLKRQSIDDGVKL